MSPENIFGIYGRLIDWPKTYRHPMPYSENSIGKLHLNENGIFLETTPGVTKLPIEILALKMNPENILGIYGRLKD